MILAIDAGNTRLKWGVHDGRWLEQGVTTLNVLPDLERLLCSYHGLSLAVISCVAGEERALAIKLLFEQRGIATYWVGARHQSCGVTNGYTEPAQLGSDRWASLVSAWHLKRSACVIASAGTALTVDALSSSGVFLGGLIVPGLGLMQRALMNNTAEILSVSGNLEDFPASTGDAVYSGSMRAMAGAVEKMRMILENRESTPPALVLTGGDAGSLQAALSGAGEIVDNLVLEGLVLIAGEQL